MTFDFNAVKLNVVTINGKPWTRTRKVCRAFEYGRATKTAHINKSHVSLEKYAHKCQLIKVSGAST